VIAVEEGYPALLKCAAPGTRFETPERSTHRSGSAAEAAWHPIDHPVLPKRAASLHYLWEGAGFGLQVFKTGKRVWIQCGSRKDAKSTKWKGYFFRLGDVASVKLADARAEAARVKADARHVVEVQGDADLGPPAENPERSLADATLNDGLSYYIENRVCAPSSEKTLSSTIRKHLADWMETPMLSIDATMLQERYKRVIARVEAKGAACRKRYSRLSPDRRLLLARDDYFTGIKTGHDIIEGFGRIYRYWIKKHLALLQRQGALVPACPTIALMDDLLPQPQRVKSVPAADLRQLFTSLETFEGNELFPLLVRLLLATGLRVGVTIGIKMEYVQGDRIVIPADAERSKVKWKKRHLEHMTYYVPITTEVSSILEAVARVALFYGDARKWLFPSLTSKSGHMEEERAATLKLRQHAKVRFTMHQLRHNVATAGEKLGFLKSEITALLGQSRTVTDIYIDERIKRHRELLHAINDYHSRMIHCAPSTSFSPGALASASASQRVE
jgi:integrase